MASFRGYFGMWMELLLGLLRSGLRCYFDDRLGEKLAFCRLRSYFRADMFPFGR